MSFFYYFYENNSMTGNKNAVYLNTAACGLIAESVLQPGIDLYRKFEDASSMASEHWKSAAYLNIKAAVATFMGATKETVALIPNCSWGINAVVQALKGDERVLLYKKDFPSVYIPFVVNKFDIVWIDDEDGFLIDVEKIGAIVQEQKIDIVAISHVQWQSGFKIDLDALCSICRQHNAQTIIDATQSLGALKIDVSQTRPDVLIASNYKWMNAGFGTGILYMDPAFLEKYPPVISGAHSNAYADNLSAFNPGIKSYEPGSLNMFGLTILEQAITEKNNYGLDNIGQHNAALTAQLLTKLEALQVRLIGTPDAKNRGSIVVIEEPAGLHAHLAANNILTTLRNGKIRISMHFHNVENDIHALCDCIGNWVKA